VAERPQLSETGWGKAQIGLIRPEAQIRDAVGEVQSRKQPRKEEKKWRGNAKVEYVNQTMLMTGGFEADRYQY